MSDKDDTITLVGWFNGDFDNPEIIFRPPVEQEEPVVFGNTSEGYEEPTKYQLVQITIEKVPNFPKCNLKSINRSYKKISRNLRDLVYSTQKLKKIIK